MSAGVAEHGGRRMARGITAIGMLLSSVTACAQPREADPMKQETPRPGSLEAARLAEWRQFRFTYVGDDQRLAILDKQSKQLRYGPFASIRARDDIGTLKMADYATRRGRDTLGVLTAIITYDVKRGPNVGLYPKLQLRPGRNALYLRYDGKVGDAKQEVDPTRWRAFVVWEGNPRDVRRLRFQMRESHAGEKYPPPSTARFEWRDDDEWVWIGCALGCCHVGDPGF